VATTSRRTRKKLPTNCGGDPRYGTLLIDDVLNRTETAMTQHHCFLATELALQAQQQAQKINLKK
jgi:hypothetical protein